MNQPELIPPVRFDAELALIRRLVHTPPWIGPRVQDDGGKTMVNKGLRAAFRHWTPAEGPPSVDLLANLWTRTPATWEGLEENDIERAVYHAAVVLHLVALGETEGNPATNLGAGARLAGVSELRFARLVNTPFPARIEALSGLFRRFRAEGVAYRPVDQNPEKHSKRKTLRSRDHDDLAALTAYLFTYGSQDSAPRWVAGYYQNDRTDEKQPETEISNDTL